MTAIEKTRNAFGTSLASLRGAGKSGTSFDDVLAQMQASAAESSGASGESSDLQRLQTDYRDNLKLLRDRIEKILNEHGVDTTGRPLTLQAGLNGGIAVSGAHPDREAIQQAIAQDPQLAALSRKPPSKASNSPRPSKPAWTSPARNLGLNASRSKSTG
ncbi:MAG: hypothetical protein QM811_02130 [Pirellulales bacterium]